MAGEPCDEDDGFEPLFDYSRQQAPPMVQVDDSDDDDVSVFPVFDQRKNSQPKKVEKKKIEECKPASVEILDDDNWLPPPPKFTKKAVLPADHTHIQLRMKQAELLHITAKASKDLEELDRRVKVSAQSNNPPSSPPSPLPPPPQGGKKEKVLIKVQDKNGAIQSFRIGKDDKFEKLFNAYAAAVKASLSDLVFRFDGEQIMASATPRNLDLEDEDVIEVFVRSGGH